MWWLFPIVAFAEAPPAFLEVPAPGPAPFAWGPSWQCSLAGAAPVCSQLTQHGPGGPWTVEPRSAPVPPRAARLVQLAGIWRDVAVAVDADGLLWFQGGEGWTAVDDVRGTTRLDGNGGLLCGATASGAWCSDVASEAADRVALAVGPVAELDVDGDAAGFLAKDGRVAVLHSPVGATGGLAERLTWVPALTGVRSLAVSATGRLACGVSAEGALVCAAFGAPSQPLTFGSEAVGAGDFYADGARLPVDATRFVAVSAAGAAMLALADDGRVFVFRPPDDVGEVFAAEGVALLGGGCIERRSGPWWCLR